MADESCSSLEPELHSSTRSTCSSEAAAVETQECATEDAPRNEERPPEATEGGHQLETESTDSPSATPAQGAEEFSYGGPPGVTFVPYESELQLPHIMRLMKADLSEPYSIYTYRYFIHNWPNLCFLAMCDDQYVGAVVCKMETYNEQSGYIAMLAVDKAYRKRKIGKWNDVLYGHHDI
jgi:peptide alpha-N-acetyltransferase